MVADMENSSRTENILEIKDLNVEYRTLEGTVYAVNGLELSLGQGEAIGLVGETGAGKTTTALSILGLLPKQGIIDEGQIIFKGEDLTQAKERKMQKIRGNEISMIFQDPMSSLNPVFSVKHQIAEAIKIHQKLSNEDANKKALEMLKAVGITEDRANNYPHEFSGGMIQRVMIAIALSCQPELLIADEPTTALDVTIQAQVMDVIKNLREDFKTSMILITHDLGVIPETCDKIAVIYAGRVVEQGNIENIYRNPLHPYTRGLFDCIPDAFEPEKNLFPIPGLSPDSRERQIGCSFYPRCSKRSDICNNSLPELSSIKKNHDVACFLYEKKNVDVV